MAHTSHSARTLGTGGTVRNSASSTTRSAMIITGAVSEPQRNMHIEPSYRLEPISYFPETTTKDIIREVLETALEGKKYVAEQCNTMCKDLANQITARVKSLGADRYKVVTFVLIGQEDMGTINLTSRCVWNAKFDTYTEYTARNGSVYAVGMVYAVYAE